MRTALLLLPLLALGCASGGQVDRARAAARGGDLTSARAVLERERDARPRSADVRIALGEVYYRIARDALDGGGNEDRYLLFFERSVDEFVAALEIDPAVAEPHLYLATMDLYRGDLDGALRGLENYRRLAPMGIAYTNLGEMYVYLGDTQQARHWTLEGLRRDAGVGPVTFNRMLIEWREGDLRSAEAHFEELWRRYPEMISTINMAQLPREPDSFEEFATYCCGSPGCGPHMGNACGSLGLVATERSLSHESVLQELRIEMEKKRRLEQIYEQRRELEIEIEDPESPAPLD